MPNPIRPLFILSLPRSGSTLLQRILATHPGISSTAETNLLLPLVYTRRYHGVFAEYGHSMVQHQIGQLIAELPNGEQDYHAAIREMAVSLYQKADRKSATYFLDKSPRYSLIATQLFDLFPDGKFIFLWRNPLAVLASMFNLYGPWPRGIYTNQIDLYKGLTNLLDAHTQHHDRALTLCYEQLIAEPQAQIQRVMDYLDLPAKDDLLSQFAQVKFRGGDPIGQHAYDRLVKDPLDKWKYVLGNPIRKRWTRRYLRWIGQQRLATMGYDLDELLAQLAGTPTSYKRLLPDAVKLSYGWAFETVKRKLFHSEP